MAMRGGPTRRVVGNPLAGVLGHLDQRARIGGRTRTSTGRREEPAAPAVVTAPVAAPGGPVGAVVATGGDGRAVWAFPASYAAPPAVTAAAVDPDPGDEERTVWAVLEEATTGRATVRVWRSRGRRGSGVAEPVGAGVLVHLIAVSSTG
jgi:hypothetical protein